MLTLTGTLLPHETASCCSLTDFQQNSDFIAVVQGLFDDVTIDGLSSMEDTKNDTERVFQIDFFDSIDRLL